jgi:hypothetical protein
MRKFLNQAEWVSAACHLVWLAPGNTHAWGQSLKAIYGGYTTPTIPTHPGLLPDCCPHRTRCCLRRLSRC